jgi:RNA polymerase sigma-70 factor (ECF subfamily)
MDIAAACLRLTPTGLAPNSETRVNQPSAGDACRESRQIVWHSIVGELAGLVRALGMRADGIDDVLSDVYVALVEKAPQELAGEDLRRWLFRVTTNRCRLEHRRDGQQQRLLGRLAESSGAGFQPAVTTDHRELGEQVERALDGLYEAEREVTVLRYFCGLNSREIGEVLQSPEGTVRSHLAKARRRLARELADWDEAK